MRRAQLIMATLRANIMANYLGQAALAVIGLVHVPICYRWLGEEAFGLASFVLSLQGMLAILDFGLSTAANKEVSKLLALPEDPLRPSEVVRTLEIAFAGIAMAILLGVFLMAETLSTRWVRAQQLPPEIIRLSLIYGGVALSLRWPLPLYQGVLRAAERQGTLNLVLAVSNGVRVVGSIVVLIFTSGGVLAYFQWLMVAALGELVSMMVAAWSSLGCGLTFYSSRPSQRALTRVWRFGSSVGLTSIATLCIKQLDRVLVSGLFPIESAGYYSAAATVAQSLSRVYTPIQAAIFPRASRLHALTEYGELASHFRLSSALVAVCISPIAAVFVFFGSVVLFAWTHSVNLASAGGPVLAVLALAAWFTGVMSVPYVLFLACDLARTPLRFAMAGALIVPPLTYLGLKIFGLFGGGLALVVYNAVYFLLAPYVLEERVLPAEEVRTFQRRSLCFLAAALAVFGLARWVIGPTPGLLAAAVASTVAGVVYGLLCIGASPVVRRGIIDLGRPLLSRCKSFLHG
jgi:O-antigen/teichoic acid export membrane protein